MFGPLRGGGGCKTPLNTKQKKLFVLWFKKRRPELINTRKEFLEKKSLFIYFSLFTDNFQSPPYSLQLTAYSLLLTAYSLQLTAYSLQLTAYSLQLTAYSLLFTAYSLQLTVLQLNRQTDRRTCSIMSRCKLEY